MVGRSGGLFSVARVFLNTTSRFRLFLLCWLGWVGWCGVVSSCADFGVFSVHAHSPLLSPLFCCCVLVVPLIEHATPRAFSVEHTAPALLTHGHHLPLLSSDPVCLLHVCVVSPLPRCLSCLPRACLICCFAAMRLVVGLPRAPPIHSSLP